MCKNMRGWRVVLAALGAAIAGTAQADWLAADPGTPISLQVNVNFALVIRPVGGTWSHAVCPDVMAAELRDTRAYPLLKEILITAATSGSVVNIFAYPDECDEHGHPIIRNVRVQGP